MQILSTMHFSGRHVCCVSVWLKLSSVNERHSVCKTVPVVQEISEQMERIQNELGSLTMLEMKKRDLKVLMEILTDK